MERLWQYAGCGHSKYLKGRIRGYVEKNSRKKIVNFKKILIVQTEEWSVEL